MAGFIFGCIFYENKEIIILGVYVLIFVVSSGKNCEHVYSELSAISSMLVFVKMK